MQKQSHENDKDVSKCAYICLKTQGKEICQHYGFERSSKNCDYCKNLINNAVHPKHFPKRFLETSKGDSWSDYFYVKTTMINEIKCAINDDESFSRSKILLENFPFMQFLFDSKNESLYAIFQKSHQYEVLEKLEKIGLKLGSNEKFINEISKEFISEHDIKTKKTVRAFVQKDNTPLYYSTNYIEILEGSAHFIASEEHSWIMKSTYFKIIQKILRVLESDAFIVNFIKLLASYDHKKVIYDFSNRRQNPCVDNKKYLNRNEVIFCCGDLLKFPIEILTGEKTYEEYITIRKNKKPQRSFEDISRPLRSSFLYFGSESHNEEVPEIPLEEIPQKHKIFESYASISHELTHWAMQLIYENHCKPYGVEDHNRKLIYEEVLRKTVFNSETIKDVGVADDKFYHAEVIVRLPHLLTRYKDDSTKISQIKKDFVALFDFYKQYIFPDLEKCGRLTYGIKKTEEINLHCGVEEIVQEENFRIKNEFINFDIKSVKSKVILITSNSPILALTAFRQVHFVNEESRKFKNATMNNLTQGKVEDEENFFIFVRQNQIFIKDFREPILEAFKHCQNAIIVIYCKPDVTFVNLIEIMQKLDTFNRVIFIAGDVRIKRLPKNFEKLIINFEWNALEDYTKERILERKILFQGRNIKLGDIFSNNECDKFLYYLINEKELDICKESNIPKIDFHIERKFIEIQEHSPDLTLSFESLLQKSNKAKILMITDLPGSGKSTELIHIANILWESEPHKMVLYVNFLKIKHVFETVEHDLDVVEFFTRKFFKFDSFEKQVFDFLLKKGNVVFIFDELDRINSDFKNRVNKFLSTVLKTTKNKAFIATRKRIEGFALDTITVKLACLTREQRREFLCKRNYLKLPEYLQNDFDSISEIGDFLKLMLLIEVDQSLDYLIVNNKTLRISKLFILFEKALESKHKKSKTKLSFDKFMKMHEKVVVENVFGTKKLALSPTDEISKLGILKIAKSLSINFAHEAIPEFILARYIFDNIQQEVDKEFIENFMKVLLNEEFDLVRKILNLEFQMYIAPKSPIIVQSKVKVKESETIETSASSSNRQIRFGDIREPPKQENIEIIRDVYSNIKNEPISVISKVVETRKFTLMPESKKLFLNKIFHIQEPSKILKNLLGFSNLFVIVHKIINKDISALNKLWCSNHSVFLDLIDQDNFDFLWNVIERFPEKTQKMILTDERKNILIVIAKKSIEPTKIHKNEESVKSSEPKSLKIEQEESRLASKAPTLSQSALPRIENELSNVYDSVLTNDSKIGLLDVFNKVRYLFTQDPNEYMNLLTSFDEDGHSVIFYAIKNNNHVLLIAFFRDLERYASVADMKSLMTKENFFIHVNNYDTLDILLSHIENIFERDDLILILNAKDITLNNPLFNAIKNGNCGIFERLMKFYIIFKLMDIKSYALFFLYAMPNVNLDSQHPIFECVGNNLKKYISKEEFEEKLQLTLSNNFNHADQLIKVYKKLYDNE